MLHQSKRRNERNMLQCPPSTAVLTIICNANRLEFYQPEGTELQWNGSRNVCHHEFILENQYQPIVVRKNSQNTLCRYGIHPSPCTQFQHAIAHTFSPCCHRVDRMSIHSHSMYKTNLWRCWQEYWASTAIALQDCLISWAISTSACFGAASKYTVPTPVSSKDHWFKMMEDFISMGLNARTCPIEILLPVPCAWVINCIRISRVLQRHQHPTDFGPPSAIMFPFFCTFVARYVIVASRSFFFCPQHRYHQWHIYPSWVSSYLEQSGSDTCCSRRLPGQWGDSYVSIRS